VRRPELSPSAVGSVGAREIGFSLSSRARLAVRCRTIDPMSNLWYVAAGLLFGALFGAVAGWLNPPAVSARALWTIAVLFLAGAVAFGVLAAIPTTSSSGSSSNDGSVDCPSGTKDSKPSTAPIADVKVTPINSVEVCVSWANPNDPIVAGFIISEYPEDATSNATPSGAPYPDPNLSAQLINIEQFEASMRPAPGEHWKMCVTPFGHGLNSSGDYPEFAARQGCSASFKWP
jgi:hypothetical protein